MPEKLFKVNVHLELMMIAEEINSAESIAVKPDKSTNVTNALVTNNFVTNEVFIFNFFFKSL